MADARVQRREPVDVEHEQRERLARSSARGRSRARAARGTRGGRRARSAGRARAPGPARAARARSRARAACRSATSSSVVMSSSLNRRSGGARQHGEHARLVRRVEQRNGEPGADRVARAAACLPRRRTRPGSRARPGSPARRCLRPAPPRPPRARRSRASARSFGSPTTATAASADVRSRAISSSRMTPCSGSSVVAGAAPGDRGSDPRGKRLVERVVQRLRELRRAGRRSA